MNKDLNDFDLAIDPFEEAVAYETLLALRGATDVKIEKEFPSHSFIPKTLSEILEDKRKNGGMQEIDKIQLQVKEFLKKSLASHRFSACTQEDIHYPENLRDISPATKLFYYKGDISFLESQCISVIGTRRATEKGLKRTERIIKLLVKNNFTVVSGLARGIDTRALEKTIELRGRVIAVIGTPINRYYPKENKDLQDKIAKNHLLMSKVPLYRYENEHFKSHKFYFPKRNALMSAISKASIIVEASETSGTHTQARAALAQGRKLFILDSCFENYDWPIKFQEKGAIKVKNEEDILGHLLS